MVAQINKMIETCKKFTNLGLVIIDSFQTIPLYEHIRKSENASCVAAQMLQKMAQLLNVPVIITSQIPRAAEMRPLKERRPMLSDFMQSSYESLIDYADFVFLLYREYYYDKEDANPHLMECIIAKNRSGERGPAYLRWDSEGLIVQDIDLNP